MLAIAVFCIGFAFGPEGDIAAFLVARQFGVGVSSSVMGLPTAAMSSSFALGAALLSFTMARTGGLDLFLVIVGTAVLIGSASFLFLDRGRPPTEEQGIEETAPVPRLPGGSV